MLADAYVYMYTIPRGTMGSIGAEGTLLLDEDKGAVLSTVSIEGLTDRTKYTQPTLKERENEKTENMLDEAKKRETLVKRISIRIRFNHISGGTDFHKHSRMVLLI